jgi:hypothetical protein
LTVVKGTKKSRWTSERSISRAKKMGQGKIKTYVLAMICLLTISQKYMSIKLDGSVMAILHK